MRERWTVCKTYTGWWAMCHKPTRKDIAGVMIQYDRFPFDPAARATYAKAWWGR